MLLAPYHKLLDTKCQADGSTQVAITCLRAYQPVEGFQAYAAAIAEPALAVGTFVEPHTSERQHHWVSTIRCVTMPHRECGVSGTLRDWTAMDKVDAYGDGSQIWL